MQVLADDPMMTEHSPMAEAPTTSTPGPIIIAGSSLMATRSSNPHRTRDGSVSFKRRYSLPLSAEADAVASTPDRQVHVLGGTPSSTHSTRSFSGRKARSRYICATASEEPGSGHKSDRKRPADVDSSSLGSLPKRLRTIRTTGTGECVESDAFCWLCHSEGDASDGCCELCPRLYHVRCLGTEQPGDSWVCPECEKVIKAENVHNRSKAMSMVSIDTLCTLLKFVIQRMKYQDSEPFHRPVDCALFSRYTDYVYNPMDFVTLERNIKKKMYGSTEAFTADVKWILHNCIVYNGKKHKLTSVARTVMKICRHETSEIEVCPDCYLNSCTKPSGDWFCEPCRVPHTLVWAKMKGYPFWPAKVLRQENNQLDVRFFGEHDRAWVPVSQVFLISEEPPTGLKNRKGFDAATEEVRKHVEKLRGLFGSFTYAPHRTPFDPKDPYLKVNVSSSGVNPRNLSSSRSHFSAFRRRQKPTISVVKNTATESSTDRPPVKMILKLPSADKHASIATETARAVKLKYSSIISTRRVSGTTPTKKIEPTLAMSVTEESFDEESVDAETQDNRRTGDDEVEEESDGEGKESCCEEDDMNEGKDDASDNSVSMTEPGDLPAVSETKEPDPSENEYAKSKVDERSGKGITKEYSSCSLLDESVETQSAESSDDRSNVELAADKSQITGASDEKDAVNANSLSICESPNRGACVTSRSQDADNLKTFTVSLSRSEVPQSIGSSLNLPSSDIVSTQMCDAAIVNQVGALPVDKVNHSVASTQAELSSTAVGIEAISNSENESHFDNSQKADEGGSSKENLIIGTISCGTDFDLHQDSVTEVTELSASSKSQTSAAPTSSDQEVSVPPPGPSSQCRALESLPSNETSSLVASTSVTRDSELSPSARPVSVSNTASNVVVQSSASSLTHSPMELSKVSSAHYVMLRDVAASITSPAVPAASSTPCVTALITSTGPTSAKTVAATFTRALTSGSKSVEMAIDKILKLKQSSISSVNSSAVVGEKKTDTNSNSVIVIDDDDEDKGSSVTLSSPENTRPVEMELSAVGKGDQVSLASSIGPVSCTPEVNKQSRSTRINDSEINSVAPVVSTVEGVLHTPIMPIEAVPVSQAAVNEKQLPNMLNSVSNASNEQSYSFNVAGYDFSKYHEMIRNSTAQMLEVFCRDMLNNTEIGSAVSKHMQLELNRAKWYQTQELEEIRNSYALAVAEQRILLEEEKEAALNELREQLCREKEQEIMEAKKKQWCAQCGKESIFYCCWNTSYCNYPCQQAHWPKHMHTCTQTQPDSFDKTPVMNQSAITTASTGGVQSWRSSVSHPARYSMHASAGQQQPQQPQQPQQQHASRMTYNATSIPSASQNPYGVVTSRPWAFTSVQQMQSGGLMRQTTAPVHYGQYQQPVVGQPQTGAAANMRSTSAVRFMPHQSPMSNSSGNVPGSGMMIFRPSVSLASNQQPMSQFLVRPR